MENIVIGIAVLAWFITKQLRTSTVRETSSLRLMLILGGIGVLETAQAAQKNAPSIEVWALTAFGLILAAVFGIWRANTVRIWRDADGVAWRKGTWLTAALWIPSLGSHILIDAVIARSPHTDALSSATILLYLAITLGLQREWLRFRAAGLPSTGGPANVPVPTRVSPAPAPGKMAG